MMSNYVTVGELIKLLEEVEDKDRVVIMSKDAEGNSYSPFYNISDNMVYEPEATWCGHVNYDRYKITTCLIKQGYSKKAVRAVIMAPIN